MNRIIALLLLPLLCGCSAPHGGESTSDLTRHHAGQYRSHRDHASLVWLADHALRPGMKRSKVEALLGPSTDYGFGDTNATRLYHSHREEPYGHILVMHFDDDRLESWEWASE